jgi:hypothetical protein
MVRDMIHGVLAFFLAGLLTAAPVPASSHSSRPTPDVQSGNGEPGVRICLELMDLEAPEADGNQEMELPPLKGEPEKLPAPVQQKPNPATAAPAGGPDSLRKQADAALPPLKTLPVVEESVPLPAPAPARATAPAPALSPMILPQPPPMTAEQRVPSLKPVQPSVAGRSDMGELKPLSVPPAAQDTLKVPAAGGSATLGSTPEVPLLTGERRQELPASTPPPPAVKTVRKTTETHGPQQEAPPPGAGVTADQLKTSNDELDRKLIEVYERFYRNP